MSCPATTIPAELKPLAPFFHDIDLGDGYNTAPGTFRAHNAINMFFPPVLRLVGDSLAGCRVLDIGCNCGGLSVAAARLGAAEILGIDPRPIHIKQARAIASYLKMNNVRYEVGQLEDLSRRDCGMFDVVLLFGVIYHLRDPIAAMQLVSELTERLVVIDSHVHFSSDTASEDMPSWWMLVDTDANDLDGLFVGDPRTTTDEYLRYEGSCQVDYTLLRDRFRPSPHTCRDVRFARCINGEDKRRAPTKDGLHGVTSGAPVMVPNRKALVKLLRWSGFPDILEIEPHRFADAPYLLRHRAGMIGLKRESSGPFPLPLWSQPRTR